MVKTTTKESVKRSRPAAQGKYVEGVGRRKTSIARVRIVHTAAKSSMPDFTVNIRPIASYFPLAVHQRTVRSPLTVLGVEKEFRVSAKVVGGGVASQVGAVRHGLARSLVAFNFDFKKKLKPFGFLTRDPRMVERKKYGLKKARRAPQWSKR